MTTPQIITLIVLAIATLGITVNYYFKLRKYDSQVEETGMWVYIVCLGMIFIIAIAATIEVNRLKKGICPEYEKIENVYKLKE